MANLTTMKNAPAAKTIMARVKRMMPVNRITMTTRLIFSGSAGGAGEFAWVTGAAIICCWSSPAIKAPEMSFLKPGFPIPQGGACPGLQERKGDSFAEML